MKNIIILKWDSLVLSIASVFYGLQLLLHPEILQEYRVYQLVDELFDYRAISAVFMILGFLKILGIVINNKKLKHTVLVLLTFFWTLFGVSFVLSAPPNTIGILSLAMAFLAIGIAIKED
ncbi:hypothetical protein P7E43_10450 [Enterococcus gallinarum]|uniref:hypothetical protein n=1 Tax=Enterococcus TaxID=1350 RepID=UPI002892407C|nr:hypothetical protein [Enterococcus gallinarum]MDT2697483.1 hypothetical protein [Enterococcus gallinarum]